MNLNEVTLNYLRENKLNSFHWVQLLGGTGLRLVDVLSFYDDCEESIDVTDADALPIEAHLLESAPKGITISFRFRIIESLEYITATLTEKSPQGAIELSCDHCAESCVHSMLALMLTGVALNGPTAMLSLNDETFKLRRQLFKLQSSKLKEAEDCKENYIIPADLKFVGISTKASWKFLSVDFFDQSFENLRYDKFDPKTHKSRSYKSEKWSKYLHIPKGKKLNLTGFKQEFSDEAAKLAQLFTYHFSDGRCFSVGEMIFHPLADLVPHEFRLHEQDQADIRMELGDLLGFTNSTGVYHWDYDLRHLRSIMQGLLQRVVRAINLRQLNFYVENAVEPGKFAIIQSVLFKFQDLIKWSVAHDKKNGGFALYPIPRDSACHLLICDKFICDTRNKTILFGGAESILREGQSALDIYGYCDLHLSHSSLKSILAIKAGVSPDGFFGFLVARSPIVLEGGVFELRKRGYLVDFQDGSHLIAGENCKTTVDIDSEGRMKVSHQILQVGESKPLLCVTGISKQMAHLMVFLRGGIPAFKGREAKMLAAQTTAKRDADMRLLKHMGFFQYLVFELLCYVLEGHLTDGQKPTNSSKIWQMLQAKTNLMLGGKADDWNSVMDSSKNNAEALFSQRVVGYFKEFIDWFVKIANAKTHLYTEDGEFSVEEIFFRELRLLHILLQEKVAATEVAQLFKARTDILSGVFESLDLESLLLDSPTPSLTERPFLLPQMSISSENPLMAMLILQPLVERGIEISFNGTAIEHLQANDLDIQLTLNKADGKFKVGQDARSLDWFSLHPQVFLKGKEITQMADLRQLRGGVIEYEGRLFLIPMGQIPTIKRLESFWTKLQGGKRSGYLGSSETIQSIPRSQVLEVLALRASGIDIKGTGEWDQICDFYDQLGRIKSRLKIPKSVKAELKPYQKDGVQWLLDLHSLRLGALLGDDMGLGKTLQTLVFLEVLRSRKELGAALIIVPPSLLFNWQSEIEKFVPQLDFVLLPTGKTLQNLRFETPSKAMVYVTTYGLLAENEAFFASNEWNILIFDEAQNLKNIAAKRTSAARTLNAQFKICLTGTPMENHYGEFYSLLDLLVPGCLGDYEVFKKDFVNSLEVTSEDMRFLQLKAKPLVLRRMKKEILTQLPEKIESKIIIPFETKQKKIYRDVAISYNEKIQSEIDQVGEGKMQLQMLTALLRLRQVCSDPSAIPNVNYKPTPPKIEALVEAVKEIAESGESVLVFTQFLSTLNKVEKHLAQEGVQVFSLHGGLRASQKKKVLTEFEAGKCGSVLIMTLKTGGVGLNLTKASYVFHLEPWWNPAAENQATDRAHRMGQKKHVQVYRYIMHESVEEKIELLKAKKSIQFDNLFLNIESEGGLKEGTKKTNRLTKEDFAYLLT